VETHSTLRPNTTQPSVRFALENVLNFNVYYIFPDKVAASGYLIVAVALR